MATKITTKMTTKSPVRVGLAVFVVNKASQFIIGHRIGSHGAGTWALPGGHIEHGESFEDCAEREVKEETGLTIKNVTFFTITNDIMTAENKHYVTIFVSAELSEEGAQEPELLEPNKCTEWKWADWKDLQDMQKLEEEQKTNQLFLPLENLLKQEKSAPPFTMTNSQIPIR